MDVASRWFYKGIGRLMALVVWLFGRYRATGQGNVPPGGPLIVVANHLNNADPPLLAAAVPRRIRFMAKQELFDKRPWGFFIRLFGAFPVRRFEADLAALREAQRLLEEGNVIGMFPEGHRSHGQGLQTPYPGVAMIALRSGAPLLPVGITGSQAIDGLGVLLRRPEITVTIGEPFTLARAERLNSATVQAGSEEIMRRIAALLPPSYRGIYGSPMEPRAASES